MVQARASASLMPSAEVHEAARQGISGTSNKLPYLQTIQRSFGRHSLSAIEAHTDTAAQRGARAMGAEAFTTGKHVVFGREPSLHTAAHEAAHAIQQRAGVQLLGGVGQAGDPYEQHADAVADRVVQGQSSESLLDLFADRPGRATGDGGWPVQRRLEGALAGKSESDIIEQLKLTYKVNVVDVERIKDKIKNKSEPYSSCEQIAEALQLKTLAPPQSSSSQSAPVTDQQSAPSSAPVSASSQTPKPLIVPSSAPSLAPSSAPSSATPVVVKPVSAPKASSVGGTTTWERSLKVGNLQVSAKPGDPADAFGQLKLNFNFTDEGLAFSVDVASKPSLIWDAGDVVEIALQIPPMNYKVGDLRIQKDANQVNINGSFTYAELAKLLGGNDLNQLKQAKTIKEKRNFLAALKPQMGFLAMWRTKDEKGEQHRSGGIDQKGGSGLVTFSSEVDLAALAKTEIIRNVGWNESELLKPGRPVYDAFKDLLQVNKELATTLEAESEYLVPDVNRHKEILAAMEQLAQMDPQKRETDYGILKMDAASQKEYKDTYYDFEGEKEADFPLLRSEVVFRRREVATDEKGTNLIAVKGRTQKGSGSDAGEAIRLAAQMQMEYDPADPTHAARVAAFLKDKSADNAFSRTLRDALKAKGREGVLDAQGGVKVKKALTIRSIRTKYKLWLANQTMIDFSADEAYGSTETVPEDPKNVIYSFEFGVGHPGLVASGAGGSGLAEEDPTLEKIQGLSNETVKAARLRDHLSVRNRLLHRPYHIPADLDNPNLFKKSDYEQYKALRDSIMSKLFLYKDKPLKGGNKASLLAVKMGLFGND